MLVTVSGGLFLLIGFLLLRGSAGVALGTPTATLIGTEGSLIANADAVRAVLHDQGLFVPALLAIGVGVAAKSAQVPLHFWLPDAMEAPTPVSAFLHSATMVKAGVYLVGRFRPLLLGEEWTLLFTGLGLATMTIAAILAVGATDIKELLAYSTASHLGLIIAGFGLANVYGVEAAVFHILNHALFKAALFLTAGIVAHEAGTRLLSELGGLRHELPITAGIAVVASLGMAGVPPFNGFYSKEFLFEATYEVAAHQGGVWWLLPVVAVFGSVFTFLYSIRFLHMFFGDVPEDLGHVHTPPWAMRIPPLLLAIGAAYVGIAGLLGTAAQAPVIAIVQPAMESALAGHEAHFSYYVPTTLKPALAMSLVTIALGVVSYPFYGRLHEVVGRLMTVPAISPNAYYDGITSGLDHSTLVERYVQTGRLRTYATALLLGTSALTLGGYLTASVGIPGPGNLVSIPMAMVLLVAVVAAVAVELAPSHVAGVLTLSILGFMVAIFYILARAPDLALTQLVIETLVLVIFLLVLDKLPEYYGKTDRYVAARDVAVSAVVGFTVFLTVILTTSASPNQPIFKEFIKKAGLPKGHPTVFTDYGGGSNIVNVILVDFRAFDTMGEISVVAMAAISVVTMLLMRERGEAQ
jgi:multicomponent Na+:H+ antiporter subunit A